MSDIEETLTYIDKNLNGIYELLAGSLKDGLTSQKEKNIRDYVLATKNILGAYFVKKDMVKESDKINLYERLQLCAAKEINNYPKLSHNIQFKSIALIYVLNDEFSPIAPKPDPFRDWDALGLGLEKIDPDYPRKRANKNMRESIIGYEKDEIDFAANTFDVVQKSLETKIGTDALIKNLKTLFKNHRDNKKNNGFNNS